MSARKLNVVLFVSFVVAAVLVSSVQSRPAWNQNKVKTESHYKCHNECLAIYDMCDNVSQTMPEQSVCVFHKVLCKARCRWVKD